MHYCCVFTYFFHFYCHFCPLHAFTWNYKCGLFSDFVIVQENIHFYMKLHILILLQWLKRTLLCSSYFMDLYVFTWICRFWFVAICYKWVKKGVKTAKSFSIIQISRFATLGFYTDTHTSIVMGTSVPVPYRFAYSSLVALSTNHIPSDFPEGHIL